MKGERRAVTGAGQDEDGQEKALCDWCGQDQAHGVFFVPGKGVFNLCENCRMLLMAVLIDG